MSRFIFHPVNAIYMQHAYHVKIKADDSQAGIKIA